MTGLLYFIENDSKKKSVHTPEELIRMAVKFYTNKYGYPPTHCQVSTRQRDFDDLFEKMDASYTVDNVVVERRRSVLLNHYYMYMKSE